MYSKIASFALLASSALTLPTPKDPTLEQIALIAGGGPSNGGAPKNISASAIANFQGVNFLENLESAFFKEGLDNLTAWNQNGEFDFAIDVVSKVLFRCRRSQEGGFYPWKRRSLHRLGQRGEQGRLFAC